MSSCPQEVYVIFKPGFTNDATVSRVANRFAEACIALRFISDPMRPSREFFEELYAVHAGKPFFPGHIDYMISGQVKIATFSMEDRAALMPGKANSSDIFQLMNSLIKGPLDTGKTIRELYGVSITKNVLHCPDDVAEMSREIGVFQRHGVALPKSLQTPSSK